MHEKSFMSHRCRERERIDELRSSIGQMAYGYYSEWMKLKKRSVPPIETFAESRLYSAFVSFAEYVLKTNLPNPNQFIKLMVTHNDVSPLLWCRDNVYTMYLQWYDEIYPPEVQVLESLEFAKTLAAEYDCSNAALFKAIPVDTLVMYISRRKLSPWFLLSSSVFRAHLLTCDPVDKDKLERALRIGAMIARLRAKSELYQFFNQVVKEAGL